MATEETKLYGVSHGNGNNGVSQLYPDYYVRTSDPWRLARLAVLGEFKEGKGQAWAGRHVDIDGDGNYTIYATIDAPPYEDSADGEYPDLPEGVEWEDAEDGRNWQEHNGSWHITEVFPVTNEEHVIENTTRPVYESIEDAFTESLLALVP
jgi:hypothetical protein